MTYRALFTVLALLASAPGVAQAQDLTQAIRGLIEPQLREQAGIGFTEFSCNAKPPLAAGDRFECSALDEEGDRLRYTLAIDDQGTATVALASQAASSLEPDDLVAISAPCLTFLAAFEARDWDRLIADLVPELRKELEPEQVVQQLETIRSVLGEMSAPTATWYSFTDAGTHRLEFRLPGNTEGVAARFQLAQNDQSAWVLNAFLIHAMPGTPANEQLVFGLGRSVLGELLGGGVVEIDAPVRQLESKGDLVEGSISLEDGRKIPIVVQQTGNLQDFDAQRYFFSVLDAEIVVRKGIEGRIEGVTGVECQAPQVPDGGEIACVVERSSGPPLDLVLSRRGAEHRLRAASGDGG